MPYNHSSEPTTTARSTLPKREQEDSRAAFDSACDQYNPTETRRRGRSQEDKAYAVARKKEVRPCTMANMNIRGWMH